jgi:O-antigen biosynthesis protein
MKLHLHTWLQNLKDFWLIKRSGLFDPAHNLRSCTGLRASTLSPLLHFVNIGWKQGCAPSADFDTRFYLRENRDVRHAEVNPLVHYIKFGMAEGRATNQTQVAGQHTYAHWIQRYDFLTQADRTLIRDQIRAFNHQPLISILMPLHEPEAPFLRAALESVLDQLYHNWELCIAVDAAASPETVAILEAYAGKEPRIKLTRGTLQESVSGLLNSALGLADGAFIGLLGGQDCLRPHTLYLVAHELQRFPDADLIYTDEDLIDDIGERYQPYFKPDFNPDLFLGQDLMTRFGVFRRETARKLGGFRVAYKGAQAWDLALRITENVPDSHIRHIPFVLYHQRGAVGSLDLIAGREQSLASAQSHMLADHFTRNNKRVEVLRQADASWRIKYRLADPPPRVSVIIPTRNQVDLLKKCLDSINTKTRYPNYQVVIVDNQSDDPQTLAYFKTLRGQAGVTLLRYDHPFNFSAINNFAARHAAGDLLVFLNNDVEVIAPGWLEEMASQAVRPGIGVVGAMLYYSNDTIQHAGVVLGLRGVAGHIFYQCPRGTLAGNGRAHRVQNYSAVTGACLAVEKAKFMAVGGFNPHDLPIAYNDIDLCLKLIRAGYRNLWTPHAELYHTESASRAYEDTPEKQTRVKAEADYLRQAWPDLIAHDPAYNPNLTIDTPDFYLAYPPRVTRPWQPG